jgi:general L-amino acid transport system permease protein
MTIVADPSFVRDQLVVPLPPPGRVTGVFGWMRRHLFGSIGDTVLTILAAALLLWILPGLYDFLIGKAVFSDPQHLGGEACRLPNLGACWLYVYDRFDFFIYGFYPASEYWRVNICFALCALIVIPLLWPGLPFKRLNTALFLIVLPAATFVLVRGGSFGLEFIPTEKWGGLMVTLIIAIVGITCSAPLGILLALGRQSKLPIIRTLCILFIELWRAVPLITVLFMASVMLPLFMPEGTTVDKLLRALVGVTLFESAYLAEVVRGGLQALPRGQYEASSALGLSYWKSMTFIILPQALKHVIPGIVGNFISLFKDTSLVAIVGIFDLLNTVQNSTNAQDWKSPTTAETGYLVAAFIFWIFCFSMSRYSMMMERRLDTGHKR